MGRSFPSIAAGAGCLLPDRSGAQGRALAASPAWPRCSPAASRSGGRRRSSPSVPAIAGCLPP